MSNPSTASKGTVRRKNFTLPPELTERMKLVREKTGIQSDSELVRRAFNLLEKVLSDGESEVVVRDKSGKEKIIVIA